MTRNLNSLIEDEFVLLKHFNDRDSPAMGRVYSLFYDELNRYAAKLYYNTEILPNDIVHDVFINIWQNSKIKFNYLSDVKSYIYASIRNNFKNYLTHRKNIDKYKKYNLIFDDDYFILGVAENEIYSIVNQAVDLLPIDCAEIVSKIIDGWSIKDIAYELNKPQRTVYNKRDEAIKILKRKITKNKILNLFFITP